jgi:nifR3 family TIM-barrel protein
MMSREFQLAGNKYKQAIILAPMDSITDLPFRVICRRLGADIVFTEFLQAEAIANESKSIIRKREICEEEAPVAIQIYSADEVAMVKAVKSISKQKPAVIDLNFGCWKPGITGRNACAGMLRYPDTLISIVKACIDATNIPITVKTRLGWDKNSIIIEELAPRLEEVGCSALSLHCRTRDQALRGKSDWSYIPRVSRHLKEMPLFVNGDIHTPVDIKNAFEIEGSDGIMIGRGCVGNPFIFNHAKQIRDTGVMPEVVSVEERFEVCKEHLNIAAHYSKELGIVRFRKHYKGYFKDLPYAEEYRKKLVLMMHIDEINEVIDGYYKRLKEEDLLTPIKIPMGSTITLNDDWKL